MGPMYKELPEQGRAVPIDGLDRKRRARKKPATHVSLTTRLHRWVGLTLGLILVMCGLTGSYLAFYMEIEKATIAPLQLSEGKQPKSLEAVYQALAKVGSPDEGRWSIELPPDGGVITSRYSARGSGNRMVSLDPITLEVVRDVRWGETLSTWIYELHYRLLMGRDGAPVMGTIGVGVLIMLIAGIVLWWRSGKTARSRLTFARTGPAERKIFDLHRLLGVGSAMLLIVSVGTAALMSFPNFVRPVLTSFSPSERTPNPESGPPDGRQRLPVDQAIFLARQALPGIDIRWVQVPGKETAPYAVRFWEQGEPGRRFPRSYIWLDQYDGRILAVQHGSQGTATDRILALFYPLHSGEAFGLFGRIIVAVLGFVPAILFITGLLRWRSKAKRLRAYKNRNAA
jgi:uncharacterized iron-regulated membrane protein